LEEQSFASRVISGHGCAKETTALETMENTALNVSSEPSDEHTERLNGVADDNVCLVEAAAFHAYNDFLIVEDTQIATTPTVSYHGSDSEGYHGSDSESYHGSDSESYHGSDSESFMMGEDASHGSVESRNDELSLNDTHEAVPMDRSISPYISVDTSLTDSLPVPVVLMESPDISKQTDSRRSLSVETAGLTSDVTLQSLKAHIQLNEDLCRMINSPDKATITGDQDTSFGPDDPHGDATSFEDAPPPSPIQSVKDVPSYETLDHSRSSQFGQHFSSEFSAFDAERVTKGNSGDDLVRLTEESSSDDSFVDSVSDDEESEQEEDLESSYGTSEAHSVVCIPPLDSPVEKEKLETRQFRNHGSEHHSATSDIVHQIKQHVVGLYCFAHLTTVSNPSCSSMTPVS
jgi:hypothetical protein